MMSAEDVQDWTVDDWLELEHDLHDDWEALHQLADFLRFEQEQLEAEIETWT